MSTPTAAAPRRILVTASRDWTDRDAVFSALQSEREHGPIIVVHGANPSGGDAHSEEFYQLHKGRGVYISRFPAQWWPCRPECYHKPRRRRDGRPYCPAAGNYRNQDMVDAGASACHAFPLEQSKGTFDCMVSADAAGIPVINHGYGADNWKALPQVAWRLHRA